MPINATFHGFVETTTDALLLFEACRRGVLPKISRRLQERERGSIRSGTVFIFDEKESGIKRWTDGLIWSPSRILGNFLIYRELGGRESLNDSKGSMMGPTTINHYDKNNYFSQQFDNSYNSHQQSFQNNNQYDYCQQNGNNNSNSQIMYGEQFQESTEIYNELDMEEKNRERNIVGSLTDTYKFRKGGLVKKTLSIQINGCTQHMISYYTKEDVLKNRLATPSSIPAISSLQISPELLLKQSFRVPPSVEFAEMALKRPSLSPSSTSSSTTSSSTATVSNHLRKMSSTGNMTYSYHPYHQSHPCGDDTSGFSRRNITATESLSPLHSHSRHFSKRLTNDNDNNNTFAGINSRRLSYQSWDNIVSNSNADLLSESLPNASSAHSNFTDRSPISMGHNHRTLYETTTSQYQNVSQKAYFENRGKIQRRHSNNYYSNNSSSNITVNRRQNSCHLSSSPDLNYYGQRACDIPTISSLPSPSFQQQPPSPPPVLSPSRFLWSANDDQSIGDKANFVNARNHSSTSAHYKQQGSFLFSTSSPTSNNSLPRCFEGTGKIVLNGINVNNTSFFDDSTLIQNNSNNNFYYQQQRTL